MSTPNKRRKKNDSTYQTSPSAVRSLDFFFNKQQSKAKAESNDRLHNSLPSTFETEPTTTIGSSPPVIDDLTDEQLARKLQAEWDEQDRVGTRTETTPLPFTQTQTVPAPSSDAEVYEVKQEREREHGSGSTSTKINPFEGFGKKPKTLSLQAAIADEDAVSYQIPFEESPLTFDPQKYLPDLKREWQTQGQCATYALLTHGFVLINGTQSRIKIVDTLVNLLRTIIEGDPQSLLPAVWLATNSISPPYIDVELGLGGSAISKALKKVCGLDNASLKTLYNKHGDAGDVAFEAKKRQSMTLRKPQPLTIRGVFDSLFKIAHSKGHGSQEVKQRIVERLVQDARGAEESRYVVRTLVQHLRIGAVKTTMLIALSRAFLLSRPPNGTFAIRDRSELVKLGKQELADVYAPAEELVKASFARRPNYNDLVPTLLEIGIDPELIIRCGLALHIPLRPMLGGITRDLGEMLTRLQDRDFACEFKYDGQRAQVHCDAQGKVTIFSRHLEVMTDKYPDLVALVPKIRGEGVSSFIMEGEVAAIDRETGDLKAFQILANRARKDVVIHTVKVDVCLFAFDLMYLNGEELLSRSFRERRNLLRSLFIEIPNHFTWVKSMDATSADGDAVSDFFRQATDIKCEGIMVKVLDNLPNADLQEDGLNDGLGMSSPLAPPPTPSKPKKKPPRPRLKTASSELSRPDDDMTKKGITTSSRRKALLSTYEPDKRLDSWLKVKKDYNTQFDTIDLIPVGAWHGQGRKNAWWSPILLACRNETTGALEVVTKCISGFNDAFYKANKLHYAPDGPNTRPSRPPYVEYIGEPDIWFEPQEVWEMAFADITLSPTYTAAIGLVSEERGLSMRFPRFLRVREDKGLDEASTNEFLAGLYRKQELKAPVTSTKPTSHGQNGGGDGHGGEKGLKEEDEGAGDEGGHEDDNDVDDDDEGLYD